MPGTIAIVGRPNVGKSALFNRIAGRRIAIVHDQPGVTRDRITAEAEWNGRAFTLVDTGGIGLIPGEKSADIIATATLEQVNLAIESADAIIFVVDIQEGIVPLDEEVAQHLRHCGKPTVLAVNKSDHAAAEDNAVEFAPLGFENSFPVSALHDRGMGPLMTATLAHLPDEPSTINHQPSTLNLAIVGRPNVGKSSIINALTESDRVIVSEIPGTTRDAVDVPFTIQTDGREQHCLLIDTAGLRKKSRVKDTLEYFSVTRAADAIKRCDIAVLVIDAETGIVEQDKKIADLITKNHRACIVVINKWDLTTEAVKKARKEEIERRRKKDRHRDDREKRLTTLGEFGDWVQEQLFFLDYAPVIFTSALDGFQLDRLLEAIRYVADQWQQQIPTPLLNRTLHDAVDKRQPPNKSGRRFKVYYATQTKQAPPTFTLFVNAPHVYTDHYNIYLTRQLRAAFGFEGCPLRLHVKQRPKSIKPIRK
jgi:GTP-binding protein